MRTATLEVLLLAVAGGLLGAWIVLRRLAFFAHAVGGATFPGLVLADATGVRPIVAALTCALAYAGGVHRAGSRAGGRAADAVTGLLLVAALAGSDPRERRVRVGRARRRPPVRHAAGPRQWRHRRRRHGGRPGARRHRPARPFLARLGLRP